MMDDTNNLAFKSFITSIILPELRRSRPGGSPLSKKGGSSHIRSLPVLQNATA
jgi:hypothetical protein